MCVQICQFWFIRWIVRSLHTDLPILFHLNGAVMRTCSLGRVPHLQCGRLLLNRPVLCIVIEKYLPVLPSLNNIFFKNIKSKNAFYSSHLQTICSTIEAFS